MRVDFPPLYVVLDAPLLSESPAAIAWRLVEAGVTLLQYRDKQAPARRIFDVLRPLAVQLRSAGARLIVNDRPDIAALSGASGVHVGQDDLDPESARIFCPVPQWVGVSTHTLEQVREAASATADYVAFGPVFETRTKNNPDRIVGLDMLRQARRLTSKPLVAIGGITAENAASVYNAGADCVAVARDVLLAESSGARAREYLKIAESVKAT